MALSSDLISQFVKITKDEKKTKQERTVYGTIVQYEGSKYVRFDGSDLLTPATMTVDAEPGERVSVLLKDHMATVTGNISSPAARTETVNVVVNNVGEMETVLANTVKTDQLAAQTARIDTLEADNVTISDTLTAQNGRIVTLEVDNATVKETLTTQSANIGNLEADNATINERLTANEAAIKDLKADNIDTETLYATFATIENLNATNAVIETLEAGKLDASVASMTYATVDSLNATKASIDDLEAEKLDATTAAITYATIDNLNSADAKITNLTGTFGDFQALTTNNFAAVNASIGELETNKLSATDIEGKYANIDFSNISKATMEYFYANSGLIEDVTVGDATITGKLVGVTISGDLIEANTLVADKLVIQGTDGLYYKLNTDGIKTEAQQTDYNSLNGTVIKAQSITASKINVDDLVAFDATIGGFNITEDSIYSGVKETVNNTTRGIYLDNDGQMAFGDASNFVKYFKDADGKYKLTISADSVTLTSSNQNIATALAEVSEAAQTNSDDLAAYITAMNSELTNLQQQIDGSITTWFHEYEPTNSNAPASAWTTTDTKNVHLGDLFYDTITGYCYRWQVQNNNYSWNRITDVDVTKALADAHAAQDTADNKRRVFVSTPTPPYDVGDLWTQGSTGDLLRCKTAKTESQSYASADWVKASKYTDDTVATAAQNGVNALTTRMNTAETNISQNSNAIALRATKTELTESLSNYYTKEQSDSNLTVKADEIASSVATTYATKTALATTDANVTAAQTAANNAQADIDGLEIGGRNLLAGSAKTVGENSPREFVQFADIAPIIDTYGLIEYTISFDIKSADISKRNTVQVYLQNGSGARHSFSKWVPVTTEWQRQSITVIPELVDESLTQSMLAFFGVYDTGNTPIVRNVKVEKGNRATDWTPAPEDFDADIAALESRVTEAETSITQNAEAIALRATKSEVTTTLGNYYTKEQSDSKLTVKANEITSSVSSTYATKTALNTTNTNVATAKSTADSAVAAAANAQADIDGLSVGGKNLFRGSITDYNFASNNSSVYPITSTLLEDVNGRSYRRLKRMSGTNNTDLSYYVSVPMSTLSEPLLVGETYTASIRVRTNANFNGTWMCVFYGSSNINHTVLNKTTTISADEEWHRAHITFVVKEYGDGAAGFRIIPYIFKFEESELANVYVDIMDFKMEKGNRATDWTPAPEDVDAGIVSAQEAADNAQSEVDALEVRVTSAETSITQNTNAIALRATKTEVATAKSEAINAANVKTLSELEKYSTTAEMNSAIEVKADAITSSVSSTYATKTALNTTNTNVSTAQTTANNAQSAVTKLTTRVTTAESSITQLSNKINANVTETTNLGTRMTTMEQNSEGFNWSVEDDLRDEIDSITIGGRNMLTDTTVPSTNRKLSPYHKYLSDSGNADYMTAAYVAVDDLPISDFTHVYQFTCKTAKGSNSGRSLTFYSGTDPIPMINGQKYTMSMYARTTSGSGAVRFQVGSSAWINSGFIAITSKWERYSWTFTYTDAATGGVNGTKCYFGANCNLVGVVQTFGWKLEIGTRATDWTPSAAEIIEASKTATNHLSFSNNGLVIGDMTADTLGRNVMIDSDSVDIRNGSTVLASYGDNDIYLAKNSRNATIDMCNGLAKMYHESKYSYDTQFVIDTPDTVEIMAGFTPLCLTSTLNGSVSIQFANSSGVLGGIGIVGSYLRRYGSNMFDNYTILDSNNYFDVMDSGWIYGGVLGENFSIYNNDDSSKVRYRKIGKTVEIRGVVKPTKIIPGSTTQYTIFTLPSGYRPPYQIQQRCQGSGVNTWLLSIQPGGSVNFSRYGNSSWVEVDTGVWLPFQATFFVD